MDNPTKALYAGLTYLPANNDEIYLVGDAAGFLYQTYRGPSDSGAGIAFTYQTKAFDLGQPSIAKQFSKVVVYIDRLSNRDLMLQYWAGYRVLAEERSEISVSMDEAGKLAASLWDLAVWDSSMWDEYALKTIPIVFNLNSNQNNNQGDSIMLKFSQLEANAPVVIHGFSIYWDQIGPRK